MHTVHGTRNRRVFVDGVDQGVFRAVGGEMELRDVMFSDSPPRFVLVNYNRLHTRNSFFIEPAASR